MTELPKDDVDDRKMAGKAEKATSNSHQEWRSSTVNIIRRTEEINMTKNDDSEMSEMSEMSTPLGEENTFVP